MFIRTANQQHIVRMAGGYRTFIEAECFARWSMLPKWKAGGESVKAKVIGSNWCVSCPTCSENIVAEFGEPHFCPNCMNVENFGLARPVVWPSDERRVDIERVLSLRPVPETRCWEPHETAMDLQRENLEHGIRSE